MTLFSRKTRILIATLCLCATAALAQEKPKVALYIANESLKPDEKSFLTNKLLKPFTQSGLYNVIDRSDIFTQKAAAERIKQRDGSVNDKEIYKIGYEAGAKYICMVELRKAFGRWNIAARMVDVVTAEIYLAQGETDIAGELDKADFSGAAAVIFDQIHGKRAVGGGAAQTQQAGADGAQAQQYYQAPALIPAPSVNYGSLRDGRDGKTYKTVKIGGYAWLAENLNYQPQTGNSWCYENDTSNCDKYGRLYDWKTAQKVCMAGWHLPSFEEWERLAESVGGADVARERLKAKSGWHNNGNGTDDYGFSGLPGGYRFPDGLFKWAGTGGFWWVAKEISSDVAYTRRLHDRNKVYDIKSSIYSALVSELVSDSKSIGISVRCIGDN